MKTFIIVMETAFIAFMFGGVVSVEVERQRAQRTEESSKEETPA